MKNFEDQIQATLQRYKGHNKQREKRQKHLEQGGDWRKVEEPERVRARLERLGLKSVISEAMADVSTEDGAPRINVLERVIDQNELIGVDFLFKGALMSRSVGRVIIRSTNGARLGFGTGFMVSPRLFMTNNHVLNDVEGAASSTVQFAFYETFGGTLTTPIEFGFDPDLFFITDPALDFTLVAVSERNEDNRELTAFGWNPLVRESGKALVGERVNIVQHPGGEPMQLSLRDNRIIDLLDDFLHYRADTQPGSSGSPVFNDRWEVAALHHSGVPEKNEQGQILLKTGEPWDGRRSTAHSIAWVANEGVRISRIVRHIDNLTLEPTQQRLFDNAFVAPSMVREAGAITSHNGASSGPGNTSAPKFVVESDGSASWLFKVSMGLLEGRRT